MTRPQIIRADTIDLQAQDSPSAKDHTRQPAHPAPFGDGPPAPHQERALKHAEQETAVELHHTRSPRVSQDLSGKELQLLQEDGDGYVNPDLIIPHQDQQISQRNGATHGGPGMEADGNDVDGDDGLEDELMDKISSSPSIDEGGYSTPLPWPSRADSLHPARFQAKTPSPPVNHPSSSPLLSNPLHFPLFPTQKEQDADAPSEVHHHQGGYDCTNDQSQQTAADDSFSSEMRDQVGPLVAEQQSDALEDDWTGLSESYGADMDPADLRHLLLPANDPLLDNSFDDADITATSSESSSVASQVSLDGSDEMENNEDAPDGSSDENDDDETEDFSLQNDPRYVDSGWGGECLRDTEDIDFEFVYALHTFIATVEGQANATKGDTMVLLDDSNSYWWLVRVVKDSSIGYLPAEHIETPTERLARLNKHRNIDLTANSILDEQNNKTRNPLKKAMNRRRKVQFTAPTYVEASDVEYSTEEEGEEGEGEYLPNEEDRSEQQEPEQEPRADDDAVVETLKAGSVVDATSEPQTQVKQTATGTDQPSDVDRARTSDEMFDYTDDGTASKSRKGTVRNTDSFFKDDNTETRKINLTPSLLRDDSSGSVKSLEAKELKTRPSIDSLEKNSTSPEKSKDDRKRKEKKSMLSGFFKRKDKKGRHTDDSTEDGDKVSEEQPLQSGHSLETSKDEAPTSRIGMQQQPQRQTSKLQKSPPSKLSPRPSVSRTDAPSIKTVISEPERTDTPQTTKPAPQLNLEFESKPLVDPEPQQLHERATAPSSVRPSDAPRSEATEMESPKDSRRGMFSPIRDVLRSAPASSEPKPEKAKKAKHRMPIDDFDSSSDTDEQPERSRSPVVQTRPSGETERVREGLSESPVQVSPQQEPQYQGQHPPGLMIDTSSQEEPSTSPVSPLSSAELVDAPNEMEMREETPASTAQSSTNAPSWSDAHLRAYLEDGSEIRDLLVVVHNRVDVKPAPPDHPLVKDLFKEENRKLGEISSRLDHLLGDWLAKKSKTTGR
ncbi:protein phosphatase regulator [Xanthoria parietina]